MSGLGSVVEAFRFRPGLVTQSDAGNAFTFEDDKRWFSLGRLTVGPSTVPSAQRSLYGFRLQKGGQGLTMGYGVPNSTPNAFGNPFIEWIGNDAPTTGLPVNVGNLEFYTASNPSLPSSRKLSFTLRSDLTALFGEVSARPNGFSFGQVPDPNATLRPPGFFPKVEVNATNRLGLFVNTIGNNVGIAAAGAVINCENVSGSTLGDTFGIQLNSNGSSNSFGLFAKTNNLGSINTGIYSELSQFDLVTVPRSGPRINYGFRTKVESPGSTSSSYGLFADVIGSTTQGAINAAVYGTVTGVPAVIPALPAVTSIGSYAGYINGLVYSTTQIATSDSSLKKDIKPEANILDKLAKINPVTYDFIQKNEVGLNLPAQLQHGFIAQDLEKIYPELVSNLVHPVFNEKREQTGTKTLKGVNYMGLISILVASVNELNKEVTTLKEKLVANDKVLVVKSSATLTNSEIDLINEKGYFLAQNTPNPFKNSTTIEYALPLDDKNASILIFNLNGQTIKEYKLLEAKGTITIDANTLTKGLYLYSLISNGQEIATKKMLVN